MHLSSQAGAAHTVSGWSNMQYGAVRKVQPCSGVCLSTAGHTPHTTPQPAQHVQAQSLTRSAQSSSRARPGWGANVKLAGDGVERTTTAEACAEQDPIEELYTSVGISLEFGLSGIRQGRAWVGVRETTKLREMERQSPLPNLARPSRNMRCSSSVQGMPLRLSWSAAGLEDVRGTCTLQCQL